MSTGLRKGAAKQRILYSELILEEKIISKMSIKMTKGRK